MFPLPATFCYPPDETERNIMHLCDRVELGRDESQGSWALEGDTPEFKFCVFPLLDVCVILGGEIS